VNQIREIAQIGFLDCAGFEAECQGVWVGRDSYCRDFEKLLLKVFAGVSGFFGAVFPADWNKTDRHGCEEFALI